MEQLLTDGVNEYFTSERYHELLDTITIFPQYSMRNTILIAHQMPHAQMIAGFKKWDTEYNRRVMRGAKALKIYAPHTQKVDKDTPAQLDAQFVKTNEKTQEDTYVYFRTIPVFDISQTAQIDGRPEIVHDKSRDNELKGDVPDFETLRDVIKHIPPSISKKE